MQHILPAGAILLAQLCASYRLSAETPAPRLDEAVKEIAILRRMAGDQDRRIANLERTVRSLQTTVLAAARPVRTSWRNPERWAAVKIGMSREQVVGILGEPKSTYSVMDHETLFYKDATDPVGNVIITDDRVSEVDSPRFQIYVTSKK